MPSPLRKFGFGVICRLRAKAMAKRLASALKEKKIDLSHVEGLNIVVRPRG
jgi:hypothetical protein